MADNATPKRATSDFLGDDCGKNALLLAARGNTIIAELLRFAEHIPKPFLMPEECEEQELLCDFSYFRNQDAFEKKIQDSTELSQRDDEFRDTHMELLECFYKLFLDVYCYAMELNRFVHDICDGTYVLQSIDSILSTVDGAQLLCEVFYLYGTMLLLMDYKIEGKVRERLIVSYVRYRGAGGRYAVEITYLCRATGYQNGKPPPHGYPVAFFARVPVRTDVVAQLITRIRSSDIYQMLPHYPLPEHRCVALSLQGAVLFVLLFFRSEMLESALPVMREIVDRHFADNWVINYYLGFTADLSVAWSAFPAASSAIRSVFATENVAYHVARMKESLRYTTESLTKTLYEGVLTEEYVLDHIYVELLPLLREANVVLRWCVLHSTGGGGSDPCVAAHTESFAMVRSNIADDDVMALLFATADLEFHLRRMFTQFLKDKRTKWRETKRLSLGQVRRLSQHFSGHDVLSSGEHNPQLEEWFGDVAARIARVNYTDGANARWRLQKLIKALENVQEFSQVNGCLPVLQYVRDACTQLHKMLRILHMENRVLITMSVLGDFSYAWERMSSFHYLVDNIQEKIKHSPALSTQMRSVFVKLSTMLELPCNRIDEACACDTRLCVALEATSVFYSAQLVVFARRILQVIPTSIFLALRRIMQLLTDSFQECPSRVHRSELKELSQLAVRGRLSTYTADIARYARGILAMESAVLGVVEVDPHQLLEDGIRRELVGHIAQELHTGIRFIDSNPLSAAELNDTLVKLSRCLNGIRHSFEYVQDYINVHGLRLWTEEFSRLVLFNVEMEGNAFVPKKVYPWGSTYQSEDIPIPYFEREKGRGAYSFLGHLVQHLLHLTDPSRSLYLLERDAWVSRTDSREMVGAFIFNCIADAIGAKGLEGLDRLLCLVLTKDLQLVVERIRLAVEAAVDTLTEAGRRLSPASSTPTTAREHYESMGAALGEGLSETRKVLVRIGRLQLMRRLIATTLRCAAKLSSGCWYSSLCTLNEAVMADVRHDTRRLLLHGLNREGSSKSFFISDETLAQIVPLLTAMGITDTANQVFCIPKPICNLVFYLLTLILRAVPSIPYDEKLVFCAPAHACDLIDPQPFAAGVALLLKQFHPDVTDVLLAHLAQAVRVDVVEYAKAEVKQQQVEVLPLFSETLTAVLRHLVHFTGRSEADLAMVIPLTLLGVFRYHCPATQRLQ